MNASLENENLQLRVIVLLLHLSQVLCHDFREKVLERKAICFNTLSTHSYFVHK